MFDQLNVGMNGMVYDFGWVYRVGSSQNPAIVMGINVNRAYSSFEARLGVQDTSEVSSAGVAVIADGATIFSKIVALKQSYDVKLPVAGVVRLEIKAFSPQPNGITFAVGDPMLRS